MKIYKIYKNTLPSVLGFGVVLWLADGAAGLGGVGFGGGKETELTRDGGLYSLRETEPVLGNSGNAGAP